MNLLDDMFLHKGTESEGDAFVVVLQHQPQHPIYKVHFHGQPITPGACLMQLAGELLEKQLQKKIALQTIKNVKFLSMLVPQEDGIVKFVFSGIEEDEVRCSAKVEVRDEENVYAKMSLVYNISER